MQCVYPKANFNFSIEAQKKGAIRKETSIQQVPYGGHDLCVNRLARLKHIHVELK